MLDSQNNFIVKNLFTNVLIATGVFAISTLVSANTLPSTIADYNFTVENIYKGTATRELTKSKQSWHYKVKAKVVGVAFASQKSIFKINGSNVIPSTARTTINLLGMNRSRKLKFSASGRQVTSIVDNNRKSIVIPEKAFDELSLETQIRQDLLDDCFTGYYYQVNTDNIEKTIFERSDNHNLSVPAGTFNTVKVKQVASGSGNHTTLWLAPSLDYLPIKMVQTSDGKKIEMELTKFSIKP